MKHVNATTERSVWCWVTAYEQDEYGIYVEVCTARDADRRLPMEAVPPVKWTTTWHVATPSEDGSWEQPLVRPSPPNRTLHSIYRCTRQWRATGPIL